MPSLRTDHVAADNLRRVNYWYRHGSLLPMQRIPGFFGHQTDRSRGDLANAVPHMAQCQNQTAGGTMNCYKRDYDLLGYRYALMSQLATAGLNNVLCMIPARDEQEFALFPSTDIAFIREWLAWTDQHIPHLANTLPLNNLDQVGLGLVDGTAAFARPLACSLFEPTEAELSHSDPAAAALGFIWLFNPGYKTASTVVTLDGLLTPEGGLVGSCAERVDSTPVSSAGGFEVRQIYPSNASSAPQSAQLGGKLAFDLDGSSAAMFAVFLKQPAAPETLTVHGIVASSATLSEGGTILELAGVQGELGSTAQHAVVSISAVVEDGEGCSQLQQSLRGLVINGNSLALNVGWQLDAVRTGAGGGCQVQLPPLKFGTAVQPFPHAAEVALTPGPTTPNGNASFSGSATVPAAIFAQLKARDAAYPIVWGPEDDDASWLRPGRLLLFLQLNCSTGRSGACDDKMPASLRVDGNTVPPIRAYESRCTECTNVNHPFSPNKSARFNGWYWDVSSALTADVTAKLQLALPQSKVADVNGLFFENTETIVTDQVAALPMRSTYY